MTKLQTKVLLLAGLGALALLPGAKADARNQKTVFTFSGPVEIPGQILPAGTYVFKLHNSDSYRHIVQVFNKDENHVFGTFIAIPDYRLHPSSESIINFHERAAGSPVAIKAWFYPGTTYGHEFVYPKTKAVELAKANNTPVPAMPTELTPDTTIPDVNIDGPEVEALEKAPVMAEKPTGEEVGVAQVFLIALTPAAAQSTELPETLPTTATPLPLIGLIGLLSLGTAIVLRITAARVN
ncbi:MAG: hypothetical protein ABSG03_10500 [Bryobacteraceae bacterium]|jgi:hypothetical protein